MRRGRERRIWASCVRDKCGCTMRMLLLLLRHRGQSWCVCLWRTLHRQIVIESSRVLAAKAIAGQGRRRCAVVERGWRAEWSFYVIVASRRGLR